MTAIRGEPKTLVGAMDSAGAGQTKGLSEVEHLVHAGLGVVGGDGALRPRLAVAVPSIENGGWVLQPDGRMQLTWTIQPGAVWQDGAPVTAHDVVFAVRVAREQQLAMVHDALFEFIERVDTPDERTAMVLWNRPYIEADRLFTRSPTSYNLILPQHLLAQAFDANLSGFLDLPFWGTGFVGAGPYRLQHWEPGSHLLLQANSSYLFGRPRIDTIEVRFIGDASVTMANVLAGAVDLTLRGGLSFEQGQQLRSRWQEGQVHAAVSALTSLFPQFINPNPAVVGDLRFRRALTHAMDRQQLIDVLQPGTAIGHSSINPNEPDYAAVERSIVVYDYDPRAAVQLIEAIGYRRGADGIFRDASDQAVSVKIQTTIDDLRQKLILAIGAHWQQVGIAMEPVIIPRQAADDRQLRATFPAFDSTQSPSVPIRYHSSSIPLPENGFRGNNRSRYRNPELDALIERYLVSIPIDERRRTLAQMVHIMTDQLVTIGIFYLVEPVAISSRLVDVVPVRGENAILTWNAHEWGVLGSVADAPDRK